jgi:hypothetical protein
MNCPDCGREFEHAERHGPHTARLSCGCRVALDAFVEGAQ